MIKFLLWCLLFILCWPVALFALVLYPIVWLLLLPFRLLGIAVHGVLDLVAALLFLPARLLRAVCSEYLQLLIGRIYVVSEDPVYGRFEGRLPLPEKYRPLTA